MQREDVERMAAALMEVDDCRVLILEDTDKFYLARDAAQALRALLDRAEKAEAELAKLRADGGAAADFDERKLHDLWTMGNCRMSFDSFKGRLRAALARPSAPETLAWAVVGSAEASSRTMCSRTEIEQSALHIRTGALSAWRSGGWRRKNSTHR